jgi:hypothetical protein
MNRNSRFPALPFVLLGAMTLVSFGGPIAILVVIQGGPSENWPPDRAIEWITTGVIFGLMIALFIACVSTSAWYAFGGKTVGKAETGRTEAGLRESGDTPNTIN